MMIRVLISVKIYVLLVIYPFLLPGRLLTLFKPVLRPDPPIWTWLGKKMPFYGAQHLVTTYFGQRPIWPEKKI